MSRSRIEHPTNEGVYAVCGVDHALGTFAEVFTERREKPVAVVDAFTAGEPVTFKMALDLMIEHEFFRADDVEDCTELMRTGAPRPRHLVPLSYLLAFFWSELGGGPVD